VTRCQKLRNFANIAKYLMSVLVQYTEGLDSLRISGFERHCAYTKWAPEQLYFSR